MSRSDAELAEGSAGNATARCVRSMPSAATLRPPARAAPHAWINARSAGLYARNTQCSEQSTLWEFHCAALLESSVGVAAALEQGSTAPCRKPAPAPALCRQVQRLRPAFG